MSHPSVAEGQWQSQSGSNKYACVCRLRTRVLLLGDDCIHKKVLGACDRYLVPSRNLDDNKDFCVRNVGLLLVGTLHCWLFRLLIVAGQVLTGRFRPYLQVHHSLVTLACLNYSRLVTTTTCRKFDFDFHPLILPEQSLSKCLAYSHEQTL